MTLVFISTFAATAALLLALADRIFGKRRAAQILQGRDPTEQKATEVRAPGPAERWEIAAQQAGLNWTARTYMGVTGAGLALGLLLSLTQSFGTGLLVAGAAAVGPWMVVRYRQQRRTSQFAEQLPAALTLAANTIRAGGTMLQAVRAIARQMPEPIRGEFVRVEQALQLQVPLPVALEQARQRIGAEEFAGFVVACKVAGQAGAELDGVLDNIAREIIENRQFQEAMRSASSEGRTSAKVVTAIPFLAGGFFLYSNPRYFEPMLISASGRLMLLGAFVSIAVGWVTISRITDARNW